MSARCLSCLGPCDTLCQSCIDSYNRYINAKRERHRILYEQLKRESDASEIRQHRD